MFAMWWWGCAPGQPLRADVTIHLEPLEVAEDLDQDGVTNLDEHTVGTDPNDEDTDGDGLHDGEELIAGTDPASVDSDGDLLDDGDELLHGADPTAPDTDLGGAWDGDELLAGTRLDDPADDALVPIPAEYDGGGGCSHAPGALSLLALLLLRVRR